MVYSLGLTVLIYGTLAYLRMKLFLKTKLTDAEKVGKEDKWSHEQRLNPRFTNERETKRPGRRETVEQRAVRK